MICLFERRNLVFQTTGSYYTLTKMPVKGKFHQYLKLLKTASKLLVLISSENKITSMI
jgi:hypothetical protein